MLEEKDLKIFTAGGTIVFAFAAIAFWIAVAFNGVGWVLAHIIETEVLASSIVAAICILILLIGRIFPSARIGGCYALIGASLLFWLSVLVSSFALTLKYWGAVGVLIGCLLGIVGIIPVGILAALWRHDWWGVCALIYGLILWWGCIKSANVDIGTAQSG